MAKKTRMDYKVVVYPVAKNNDGSYNDTKAQISCNELSLILDKLRMVDDFDVVAEEKTVCEYCGMLWKIDNDGLPECCREARAEIYGKRKNISVSELGCIIGEGWKVECGDGAVHEVLSSPILGYGKPRWLAVKCKEQEYPLVLDIEINTKDGNDYVLGRIVSKVIDPNNNIWIISDLIATRQIDGE